MDNSYWQKKKDRNKYKVKSRFAVKCRKFLDDNICGKNLLDVGSGLGRDGFYFSRLGYDVTAIDISDVAEEVFLSQNKINFIKGDVRDIDFCNKKFDIIYARLSLHYFTDKETNIVFDKLYDLLNAGGYIFVMCKSIDDKDYGRGEILEKDMFINGHVRHFFSKEYMEEKLNKFHIVKLQKTWGYNSRFIEAVAKKIKYKKRALK